MLTGEEIKRLIENGAKNVKKNDVQEHENRLAFHVDTNLNAPSYHTAFLEKPRKLLIPAKYKTFCDLMSYPISSNEISDEIFKDLNKVFFGKDKNEFINFKNDENLNDWYAYQKNILSFEVEAFNTFKTKINSIIVCDWIEEEGKKKPSYFFLDYNSVVAYEYKHPNFKYLIFESKEGNFIYYDENEISQYIKNEDGSFTIAKTESGADYSFKHELKYTPARFLWTDYLTESDKSLKKSPLSNQLSNFDKYVFNDISKNHLDLYASYPVYSTYESECDFVDTVTNQECRNGYLTDEAGNYIKHGNTLAACPVCSNKTFNGPGSNIKMPYPTEEDSIDVKDPIKITSPDIDALVYNKESLSELKEKIYFSVAGVNHSVDKSTAFNEKQIVSTYESRKNVLLNLKYNFEAAYIFTYSTLLKIRYGVDFENLTYNLGTEFYLQDVQTLNQFYNDRKAAGAHAGELDTILDQIIDLQYKNDPYTKLRLRIINNLDPLRHYTNEEAFKLMEKGLLTEEDAKIHFNLSSLIKEYERKENDITKTEGETFELIINNIKAKFLSYGNK